MALSEAERRALQERAQGYRLEISSLKMQRDETLREASDASDDAKLLAEVTRLELEKNEVLAQKESADGSVASAIQLMNDMIEVNRSTSDAPVDVQPVEVPVKEELLGTVLDTENKED